MANVMFKRGTQANFDALTSYTDGVFYLTEDTRRLFVGTEGGKAIPLCETIQFVTALPSSTEAIKGQVYYITTENILCIYTTDKGWLQINPDTKVTGVENAVESASNVATILTVLSQNRGSNIEGSFKIAGSTGINVANSDDTTVTIQGTTYTLSGKAEDGVASIILTGTGVDAGADTVKIKQGTGIKITQDGTDIKVEADIDTINSEYTLDGYFLGGADGTGFQVDLVEEGSVVSEVKLDPTFRVKSNQSGDPTSPVKMENGIVDLDTYSTAYIDNLMTGLNAMTYKGTIDGSTKLLPTTANAGDVYLINNDDGIAIGNEFGKTGDLIIATGTETNGVLTGAALTWELVPSGNDIDTQYAFENIGTGIQLKETSGAGDVEGILEFEAGNNGVEVEVSGSGENAKVTVSHKVGTAKDTTATAVSQTAGIALAVPIVTDVNYDTYGHVTEVVTQTTTFRDTDTKVDDAEFTAAATGNKATVTNTLYLKDATGSDAGTVDSAFTVTSANEQLTVTASGSDVNINFIWGSF